MEVKKKKNEKGKSWSTILQREKWSLHCSRSRIVETWKCRRRRRRSRRRRRRERGKAG
jgi:hypothetical protein